MDQMLAAIIGPLQWVAIAILIVLIVVWVMVRKRQ